MLWQSVQPDACDTAFEAASTIRGELFFFKSRYVWRLRAGKLQDGYPALASRHWQGIPSSVDATFEDPLGNIWFFQGKSWTGIRQLRNASSLLRAIQDPTSSWEKKPSGHPQQSSDPCYLFLSLFSLNFLADIGEEKRRRGHFSFRHSHDIPFSSSGTQRSLCPGNAAEEEEGNTCSISPAVLGSTVPEESPRHFHRL